MQALLYKQYYNLLSRGNVFHWLSLHALYDVHTLEWRHISIMTPQIIDSSPVYWTSLLRLTPKLWIESTGGWRVTLTSEEIISMSNRNHDLPAGFSRAAHIIPEHMLSGCRHFKTTETKDVMEGLAVIYQFSWEGCVSNIFLITL